MPITKVLSNDVRLDGSVEAVVRVRAATMSQAKNRAVNIAFLYNGYSQAIRALPSVNVTSIVAQEDLDIRVADVWRVTVTIEGLGDTFRYGNIR